MTDSINFPEPYVRLRENNERINMWVEQIRDNRDVIQKNDEKINAVEATIKAYFLPPIHVFKMNQPKTISFRGKDGKQHSRTVGYQIIDGVHRYRTVMLLGLDSVECIVHEPMTNHQAFAMQYKMNNEGPLPFNRETRDSAIRQFSVFKMDGKAVYTKQAIGVMTGISEAQVSRILSGKSRSQSVEEVSKKMSRKGKKGAARSKGGYNSAEFFKSLNVAAKEVAAHQKVLKEYVNDNDKAWEVAETLCEALASLRGVNVEFSKK